MIDKKLILLLLLLLIYVFFVKPKTENINTLIEENSFYQRKILKEMYIKENKEKIINNVNNMLKISEENKKKFFNGEIPTSQALSKISDFIKNTALITNVEFVNSYWGEPIEDDSEKYIKLPLSVTVRGYPPNIDKFLTNIFTYDKLLNIERLTTGIYEKQEVVLNFAIIGYKLNIKEEIK